MKSIGKKMLAWVLSILLIAGCCLVAGAPKDTVSAAETYTSGDYEYQIEDGCATITGYVGNGGVIEIPVSLDGYPVTKIGSSAFQSNRNIFGVTIPDHIVFLGDHAFADCTSLFTVSIENGSIVFGGEVSFNTKRTFQGCTSLQTVELPEGITSIPSLMFIGCTSLNNFEIPETVTVIEHNAFYSCENLSNITIPKSVKTIESGAFGGCVNLQTATFQPGLQTIEAGAFQNCRSLKNIQIPNTVVFLGDHAFADCVSLCAASIESESIVFGGEASFNTKRTFQGCTSLQSVEFAEGTTAIGEIMFRDCVSLTKIAIPSSVIKIGNVQSSHVDITDSTFGDCKDTLIIYGQKGSFAERYANANGIRFSTAEYTPYVDVADSGVYYRDAVGFVSDKGLMTGMNPTTFGPAENLSRAQFAVILYRMKGSPSTAGMNNPFEDNRPGTFYYDAVIWCNNAGIITGYYNADGSFTGRFGPSGNISREQLATMLYRYANYVGDDTSAATSLNRFGDAASVSSYAVDALEWAAAEGIVSGRATNPPTIAPLDNASRADVAVMLQRYLV